MSISNEWELSKENILPIQCGRKAGVLRSALSVHPDDHLVQKRRLFEQELRVYEGDDPLSVWCQYIKWVEQNYPKGGREGGIGKLIQQCLSILKDEDKYMNDDRFIDIWLKFANMSMKPGEVYRNMYERNIGCMTSRFYIAWAWEMEQSKNLKRADEILMDGIHRNAQPADELKLAHRKLEARLTVVFAAESDRLHDGDAQSEHRSAFTLLKTQEKNRAPITRVGQMTLPPSRENLILGHGQSQPKQAAQSKVPFKIFNAENAPSLTIQNDRAPMFVLNSDSLKENEKRPSKWTKVKVHPNNYPKPMPPEFTLHTDDTPQPSSVKKQPDAERVLTSWKKPVNPPVALFEPPNPNVMAMYDKSKIYGGTEEYSFEEIHAAVWFARRKKFEEEQKRLEEEREKQEMKDQLKYLQQRLQELESKTMAPLDVDSVNSSSKRTAENAAPTVIQTASSNSTPSAKDAAKVPLSSDVSIGAAQLQSPVTAVRELAEDVGGKNVLQSSIVDGPSHSSFTVNVVQNVVRELYNDMFRTQKDSLPVDPLGLMNRDSAANVKSIFKDTVASAERIEDEKFQLPDFDSVAMGATGVRAKPSAFTIYSDPMEIALPEFRVAPLVIYSDATAELHETTQLSPLPPADDENMPPPDYIQSTEKRDLSGVLQPSKDVYFVPLEERTDEHSEDEDDECLAQPLPAPYDMTMIAPLNTEHFALSAKFASTPCIRPVPQVTPDKLDAAQVTAQPPSDSQSLVLSLEEILGFNKCPRTDKLIQQTLDKVLTLHDNNKTKEMHLKMASDYLQTCLQINKDPKLHGMLRHAIALMETYVKKQKNLAGDKTINQTNCATQQSWHLSTIMENSREGSTKSSSSSSCSSLSSVPRFKSSSTHRGSFTDSGTRIQPSKSLTLSPLPRDNSLVVKCDVSFNDSQLEPYLLDIDPFSQIITDILLKEVHPPVTDSKDFYDCVGSSVTIKVGKEVQLGDIKCEVVNHFASGAYANIFSANTIVYDLFKDDCSLQAERLALKVCKSVNLWEFYICSELNRRLADLEAPPDVKESVMRVKCAVQFRKRVVLVSKLSEYGTLLDVVNVYKKRTGSAPEYIALYFAFEMLLIVSRIHECALVHCDIKPDNFIINGIEADSILDNLLKKKTSVLQLIDFGRAIDLSIFKPGIIFKQNVTTDSFQCCEMMEGRPWVHQIDWFGVLGSIHVLLFSDYMSVRKNKEGIWETSSKFKRYWQVDIWQPLFQTLLNLPSCYQKPDIASFVQTIADVLQKQSRNFLHQIRELSSILPNQSY